MAILKGRFKYLLELSLLIVSIAYNIIRIMNDLGSIKAPSRFLDMDIPSGSLLLLILLIILKSDSKEWYFKQLLSLLAYIITILIKQLALASW